MGKAREVKEDKKKTLFFSNLKVCPDRERVTIYFILAHFLIFSNFVTYISWELFTSLNSQVDIGQGKSTRTL